MILSENIQFGDNLETIHFKTNEYGATQKSRRKKP